MDLKPEKNKLESLNSCFLAMIMLSVFLFAIRLKVIPSIYNDFDWYTMGDYIVDLCSYFRMQIFLFLTAIAIIQLLFETLCAQKPFLKTKAYIPLAIYAFFVLLSFLFSEYKDVAKVGYIERYEGVAVHLSYVAILIYAMNCVRSEKNAKAVFIVFAASCVLLSFWGIAQTLGIDINNLPGWLITPKDLMGKASVKSTTSSGIIKLFFTNRNYVSHFLPMPIAIFTMLCIEAKNTAARACFAVLVGLLFFCLCGANSLGGFLGLGVAFALAVVVLRKNLLRWIRPICFILIAVIVASVFGMPKMRNQFAETGIKDVISPVKSVYADDNAAQPVGLAFREIDYIVTEGNALKISFEGEEITIATNDGNVTSVTKTNGEALNPSNEYFIATTTYDETGGINILKLELSNAIFQFAPYQGNIYFINPKGKLITLDKVEAIGFKNNLRFGTNRGYIWSRTIPLLKKTIFVGYGPDTFTLYFPHNDYAGKYSARIYTKDVNVLVDKPHNFYLGIAVNIGCVGLIAILAVYVIYIVNSIKIYSKAAYGSYLEFLGAGILFAVIGYLVGGLVNDSSVQVTPAFYVILGVGFAVNNLVKNNKLN